jgi:uncharacterized LabA/DUF88 family protein
VQTIVYIDGWNLYYGAIKGSPYRWLNLYECSCALLRGHQIEKVRYFTARVDNRPDDPHQSQRQDAYLRALGTIPEIEIHLGRFVTHTKRVRLAKRRKNGSWYDDARITEEKGSDVNLATHLVWDAAHGEMKCALVISNDSDLQESIDMARNLGVHVVTCNPHELRFSQPRHLHGDDKRNLRKKHLEKCQLPISMTGPDGKVIRRPAKWEP